jgi:perosamine synthetase
MKVIPQIEPLLGSEEREAVLATLDSGFITEGRITREFEAEAARFVGVRYALAVNNATVGLAIALMSLGIGPADEVLVPDFTFIATANAVVLAGATPVFADVDPKTFVLDLEDVRRRITSRTRAIIPVHLNGRAVDMDRLQALATEHGLPMIEDAAQALGSRQVGRHLGTFGDAGVFSLGTTKIITTGQGGIIVTHRRDVYEACVRLKDHGRSTRSSEVHESFGFNSKFTDLQAALGLAQLRKLPERIEKKRELFRSYQEELAGFSGTESPPIDLEEAVPWFVDVLCSDRDGLASHLKAAGIGTRRFYLPLHSQPCFGRGGNYPNAEFVSRAGLWLPSSPRLTLPDVAHICSNVRAFGRQHVMK